MGDRKMSLLQELRKQRWDDHRYYHHSRVNQSLHLLSALSFLTAYVYLLIDPVVTALLGWFVAMCSRQIGHFFFEPKGYDRVNNVTHDRKERIKVGYNLKRKLVLLSIWGASPIVLAAQPSLFGLITPYQSLYGYLYDLSVMWLCLAAAALVFRTVHLFFIYDLTTGLAWFVKILTDPFHDVKLYHKAPLHLLKGELIDPMLDVRSANTKPDSYPKASEIASTS
ncbi:MAG: hypothetical protein L0H73_02795 [Nitrococcus sp.]|nr:hypothetical protein [Nitrococcus sp.]